MHSHSHSFAASGLKNVFRARCRLSLFAGCQRSTACVVRRLGRGLGVLCFSLRKTCVIVCERHRSVAPLVACVTATTSRAQHFGRCLREVWCCCPRGQGNTLMSALNCQSQKCTANVAQRIHVQTSLSNKRCINANLLPARSPQRQASPGRMGRTWQSSSLKRGTLCTALSAARPRSTPAASPTCLRTPSHTRKSAWCFTTEISR